MAIVTKTTRTTNNGNTTYTITHTGLTAQIDLLASEASERIYESRPQFGVKDGNGIKIEWDDLTNAQKIALIGKEDRLHNKELAKAQYEWDLNETLNPEDPDTRYGEDG